MEPPMHTDGHGLEGSRRRRRSRPQPATRGTGVPHLMRPPTRTLLLCAILILPHLCPSVSICSSLAGASAQERQAVRVILDTDIGPDVDDAGAVAVLHALADRGEARILAMFCCTSSDWGAPCLDALNTY